MSLLGAFDVGRKQIFELLTSGQQDHYIITFGSNFRMVTYPVLNSNINLQIWDWAGKDKIIDGNMFKGTQAFIGLFNPNDSQSIQVLQEQLALGLSYTAVDESYLLLVGLKNGFNSTKLPMDKVRELIEPVQSPQLAGYNYIELEGIEDVSPITNTLIPQMMDLEKRCGNCFKVFEEVLYRNGYYFCWDCYPNADVEKAKAFVRLHGDGK